MKCVECKSSKTVPTGYNRVIAYDPVKTEAEYYCSKCGIKFFK